jgi:hypothetical protein
VTVATPSATSVDGVQPAAAPPPVAALPETPRLRARTLFDEQPLALPILGATTAAVVVLVGVGVAARTRR